MYLCCACGTMSTSIAISGSLLHLMNAYDVNLVFIPRGDYSSRPRCLETLMLEGHKAFKLPGLQGLEGLEVTFVHL